MYWMPAARPAAAVEVMIEISPARALAVTSVRPGREQARGDRRLHHPARLLQHEDAERGRQQRHRVLDVGRHRVAEQPAGQHRARQHEPAALLYPVKRRADERRQHRERRHRDDEEEHHFAARLVDRRAEEDRPGQRDGDERVGRPAGGGHFDERAEAGPVGALGAGDAVHQGRGAAGGPAARLATRPEGAARRLGRTASPVKRIGHPHVPSILGPRHCDEPYGGCPSGPALAVRRPWSENWHS